MSTCLSVSAKHTPLHMTGTEQMHQVCHAHLDRAGPGCGQRGGARGCAAAGGGAGRDPGRAAQHALGRRGRAAGGEAGALTPCMRPLWGLGVHECKETCGSARAGTTWPACRRRSRRAGCCMRSLWGAGVHACGNQHAREAMVLYAKVKDGMPGVLSALALNCMACRQFCLSISGNRAVLKQFRLDPTRKDA